MDMAWDSLLYVSKTYPTLNLKVEITNTEYETLCVRHHDDDEWIIRGE